MESVKTFRIKDNLEQADILKASILALIDVVDRIEQIPYFLEKNRKLMKSLGIKKVGHPSTLHKLF